MYRLDILNVIKETGISSIDELAVALDVSQATARRRLKDLSSAGYLIMQRGGRFALIDEIDISLDDKFKRKQIGISKILCGKIAASKIEAGDTIFIDNGTTVRQMLKYITQKDVTVYTNGIYHHLGIIHDVELHIIPGELIAREASIVGGEALNYLSSLHIDKAFIGANGYDENGVYTPHRREMILKQFALRTADQSFIVIERCKEGIPSKYKICDYDEYKFIHEDSV